MSGALAGIGLGVVGGTGLFLAVTGTPLSRKPRLDARLGPYLRDTPRPSKLLHTRPALTPFPTFERLLGPVLGDLIKGVERWVGGLTSVPGAIIGGLVIGVGEKLSEVYIGPFFGGGIEIWFGYVLVLFVLLVRPQGLFGEKIIDRV